MPRRSTARFLRSAVTALLASACLGAAEGRAAEEYAVGLVDEIAGSWTVVQGGKRLSRGDLLQNTQTVRFVGTSSGKLAVLLLDSGTLWTKTCSAQEPCSGNYRPVSLKTTPGFWSFLSRYWTSDRELSTVFARTRSIGARGPTHGLAVLSDSGADLTPLMEQVAPGTYDAAFLPAPGATPSVSEGERELRLVVVPGEPVRAALAPGLFAMTVRNAIGQIGSTVVVFVAPSGHPAETAWRDARAKAAALRLTPDATDVLLARILYALHSD